MRRPFLFLLPLLFFLLIPISCLDVAEQAPLVATPDGFAPLQLETQYAAMSPEGMIYRARIMENEPKQTLEFWSQALRTHLAKEGYTPLGTGSGFRAGDLDGAYVEWTLPFGGDTYKYLTALLVHENVIAVAEASGEHAIYDIHRDAIFESLETIDLEKAEPQEYPTVVTGAQQGQSSSGSPAPRPVERERSGCFLPGTLVRTRNGAVPIEAVWPGQELRVYDPRADSWSTEGVTRTIQLAYEGEVVTLQVADEVLEVTGRHPFLVTDGQALEKRPLPAELSAAEALSPDQGRWVEARSLLPGDALFGGEGRELRLSSVFVEQRRSPVFHMEVTGPHTYAASRLGIVVHNGGAAESAAKAPVETERASRERHIMRGAAIPASLPARIQDERVRVYSGACTLLVDQVEETKRAISLVAESIGGYVEQSSDDRIVIRVPAPEFRESFDEILLLGETLYKAIETYDVTDQFTDPSSRLAVAIRARDRLYVLLERVEDPEERLDILKQIREYTETIERLQLSSKVLEERIAMSRITVGLRSRLEETAEVDRPIPFDWIEKLHPIYNSTKPLNGAIEISFPDDVAIFEDSELLRAEAADGTRIRAGTTKNDPKGDSLFWQRALVYHLGPRYAEADGVDLKNVRAVLFREKDRTPYFYLVAPVPTSEESVLAVVEIYFPNQEALDRHYSSLLQAIDEVAIP